MIKVITLTKAYEIRRGCCNVRNFNRLNGLALIKVQRRQQIFQEFNFRKFNSLRNVLNYIENIHTISSLNIRITYLRIIVCYIIWIN